MLNTRDLYARSLRSLLRAALSFSFRASSLLRGSPCDHVRARARARLCAPYDYYSARLSHALFFSLCFSPSGGPKKVLSRGTSSLSVSRLGNKSFRLTKHSNDSCTVYFWWVNTRARARARARNKVSPRADARAWKNTALPGERAREEAMRIATRRRRREEGNANENRESARNGAIAARSLSYRVFFPRRRKRVHF